MRHFSAFSLLVVGLLPVVLLAAPPAPAPGPSPAPSHGSPFPGGLLDSSGRTAFLPSAGGGIEAIDLITGDVLWQTNEAEVPLLVACNRLYAQAGVKRNRLRLLAFDLTRKGECVLESDPVVLPNWVVTSDAHGRSFDARWRLDKDQLVLNWAAKAWFTGPKPTPEQERAARAEAEGSARIHLQTGQVTLGPAEKLLAPTAPTLPRQLEKLAVRWHGTSGRNFLAVVFEDVPEPPPAIPVAPKMGEAPAADKALPAKNAPAPRPRPEKCLMLRSWDWLSGKAAPPRELLRGHSLVVLPSVDGRHLFLRDSAPPPDEMVASEAKRKLDWSVLLIEKGEVIAHVSHVAGTQAATVVGERAYFLVAGPVRGALIQPTVRACSVHAIDVKTGKLVWERGIAAKSISPPGRN